MIYFTAHTINCVCHSIRTMFRVLGIYNFGSALKRTPVQGFNSFSIMLYYLFSTTYQRIGDLFCPVIFLNFCTVCLEIMKVFAYNNHEDGGRILG